MPEVEGLRVGTPPDKSTSKMIWRSTYQLLQV